jgi:uncharacterized protein
MPDPANAEECEQLLLETGCSRKVLAHIHAVTACALEYADRNPDCDRSLVERGAMLHDIGRAATHGIDHAQRGADLLRARGCSEPLARIVECHIGAGLNAGECTLLGLLPRDCIPTTTEEKIVTHADNLIAGHRRTTIEESIGSAFNLPKKARRRMYRLANDVELLCGRI